MHGTFWVSMAAIAFVGTHFLMSHPLRKVLIAAVGESGFLAVYSVTAIATFVWLVLAYHPSEPNALLWPVGNGLWVVVTIVMLLASILLVGSLARNPAFPKTGSLEALTAEARGVYAITRHPMLWAFALWGMCHIAIFPVAANIIVALAIIILALVGAALQDRKKERLQPTIWRAWEAKTSYVPFGAIAAGRARLHGLGWHALLGGVIFWLAITWAHIPLSGWAAGIWRWAK